MTIPVMTINKMKMRQKEIKEYQKQGEKKNKIRIEEDEEGEAREAEHIIFHNKNQYSSKNTTVHQLKRELCGMNKIVLFNCCSNITL